MNRAKEAKSLTKEQYLKTFSRAVRWRLPPQESEEAIADYRELVLEEERDESKLAEELGDPVQAAHLLTDVRTYRRWLKIFAVLAFGLFLLAKWAFTAHSSFTYFLGYERWWYPVWVMAVGMALSLYWFRRHGQKNGPMSKWLVLALTAVLIYGVGTLAWNWYVMSSEFLNIYRETYPHVIPWQIILQRELIINGGMVCALIALAGLVLAKCYDRRWLALYVLALTMAALCGFIIFHMKGMSLDYPSADMIQSYLFARLIPIGAVGLIGTGVALC